MAAPRNLSRARSHTSGMVESQSNWLSEGSPLIASDGASRTRVRGGGMRCSMRPIVLAIASVSHLACVERGGITMHAGSGSSPAIYEVAADSTSTQTCFNGAACCPAGSALRGVNLGTNPVTLDCRPTNEPFQDCFLDHSTNDPGSGMQMCPEGTYMRGVNPGAHNFVCCYDHHRGYTPFLSDQTMDASGALTSN